MALIPSVLSSSIEEHLLSRVPGGRYPLSGQWELTCRCNLKCVMCYTDPFNTPEKIRRELSTAEVFRILAEIHAAGCLNLAFTGGEPLARPDFMEIYERAHGMGFLLTIFTNGTLVTPAIADRWASLRPRCVEISLHSVTPGLFDEVTQKSRSFTACEQAIQWLVARQIPLTLKMVGMTMNYRDLPAVKRYADQLGPTVTFKWGEVLRDDLIHSGAPYQYEVPEQEIRAIEAQDAMLHQAKLRDIDAKALPAACGGGNQTFHIDAYGQLQLCSNNRRKGYDLRTGSFREGFYEALPHLPCPMKSKMPVSNVVLDEMAL